MRILNTKTVYLLDSTTGELKGAWEAQESPLEIGCYIQPASSAVISPPTTGAGQVAVFINGAWTIERDCRGQTMYDQASGMPQAVTEFGPLPSGFALTQPAPTLAQQWATYQTKVRAALAVSDTTMHRIGEGVVLGKTSWAAADVVAFVQWRQKLRAVLSQAQPAVVPAGLPTQPPFPAGT
jgi:hypothetical protein